MDGEEATRWLVNAGDAWYKINFDTNSIYNNEAPKPWVSFMIGAVSLSETGVYVLDGWCCKTNSPIDRSFPHLV